MCLQDGVGFFILFAPGPLCLVCICIISLGLYVCSCTSICKYLCVSGSLPPSCPAPTGPQRILCCLSVQRNVMGKGRGEHIAWAAGLIVMENYRGLLGLGMPSRLRARLCSFYPSRLLPPPLSGGRGPVEMDPPLSSHMASLLPHLRWLARPLLFLGPQYLWGKNEGVKLYFL